MTRSKLRRCEREGCRTLTLQTLCDQHRDKPDLAALIDKAERADLERGRAGLAVLKVPAPEKTEASPEEPHPRFAEED